MLTSLLYIPATGSMYQGLMLPAALELPALFGLSAAKRASFSAASGRLVAGACLAVILNSEYIRMPDIAMIIPSSRCGGIGSWNNPTPPAITSIVLRCPVTLKVTDEVAPMTRNVDRLTTSPSSAVLAMSIAAPGVNSYPKRVSGPGGC